MVGKQDIYQGDFVHATAYFLFVFRSNEQLEAVLNELGYTSSSSPTDDLIPSPELPEDAELYLQYTQKNSEKLRSRAKL